MEGAGCGGSVPQEGGLQGGRSGFVERNAQWREWGKEDQVYFIAVKILYLENTFRIFDS